MAGRRLFDFERVKRPSGRWMRRLIAHYAQWTEVFGYVFCMVIALAILVCWFYKVDEIAIEKDVAKTVVKPYEEQVKAAKECVVTKVLVTEWQQVQKETPLLETCDDPDWVSDYKIRQQWDTFAKAMRELEKTKPLPADVLAQVVDHEKRLAAWDAGPGKAGARTPILAPIAGEVAGTKDLEGKVLAADAVLLRVVNCTDLRLAITLNGANVERVRVGMPANVEIQPKYGKNAVVRVDTRLSFWKRRRLRVINHFDDETMRTMVGEWLKDHHFATQEDQRRTIALPAASLSELEVMVAARTQRLTPREYKETPAGVRLGVDYLAQNDKLKGVIMEGKHTATYQTAVLTEEAQRDLQNYVWERLRGRVGVIREEDGTETPVRLESLRREVRVILRLKGELPGPNLATLEQEFLDQLPEGRKAPKRRPLKSLERGVDLGVTLLPHWRDQYDKFDRYWAKQAEDSLEVQKTERFFVGTVRIPDPPKELEDAVRSLAQADPAVYLTAKVEAVVDKRRVAMLLFRQ
jgi:hypothetical protein